jgi:hypothetical protein
MTINIEPRPRQYSSAFSYVRKVKYWRANAPYYKVRQATITYIVEHTRIWDLYREHILYGGTVRTVRPSTAYLYLYV